MNAACDECKEASAAFDDDTADSSAEDHNSKKPDLGITPDPNSKDEASDINLELESLTKTSESEGKSDTVDPDFFLDEASETKSGCDISNSLICSSSAPVAVSDLGDWLKSVTDCFKA